MNRLYTIWPSDREGIPAILPDAWKQDRHWIVLDITDGMLRARVVEGPVTRGAALLRAVELHTTAALPQEERYPHG